MLRDVSAVGKLSTWQSLRAVTRNWRLLSVALLSFSSGLPLGLVWIAIPTWLKQEGIDIKVVGLFSLAQAPWSFKVLWSPLMDRFQLPVAGRKRGWILLSQAALLGLGAIGLLVYVGLLVLTYYGFTEAPTGFIPDQDKGYLLLNAQLPDAASVQRTQEVMTQIEKIAHELKGVGRIEDTYDGLPFPERLIAVASAAPSGTVAAQRAAASKIPTDSAASRFAPATSPAASSRSTSSCMPRANSISVGPAFSIGTLLAYSSTTFVAAAKSRRPR